MEDTIRSLLSNVWDILGKAGLNSTQDCLSHLAALLTESSEALASFPREDRPHKPPVTGEVNEEMLWQNLEQIKVLAGLSDNAQLFDRYILFYASTFVPKDAYPIPRHIIRFMLDILDIRPENRFADFTCGSGGFLVNTAQNAMGQPQEMVGVEISADWKRIAVANAVLHQLTPPQIELYTDDAFHACGPEGVLRDKKFHRIALAPSFGRNIDKKLAQVVLEDNTITTGASEALFTYLAQKKLEPGGRAVIMVPISLLTNKTGNTIRRKLINERVLEAVITFQPGMLQPFNNERVALLVIQQTKPNQPLIDQCLFINLEHDGYPLNRGRDLLLPPSLPENDLPLAHNVLLADKQAYQADERDASQIVLEVQHQIEAPVTLIRVSRNTTLLELRHFAVQANTQIKHYLLAQIERDKQIYLSVVSLQPREETFQAITDTVAWRRELYQISSDEISEDRLPTGDLLLEQAIEGQQAAITQDGRLLGLSQSFTKLVIDSYSLITDSLLQIRTAQKIATTTTPSKSTSVSEAIAEVYQIVSDLDRELRQNEKRINRLQGYRSLFAKVGEPLPQIQPVTEQILRYLGTEQQTYWKELQKLIEVSLENKGIYPRPFHLKFLEQTSMNQTEISQMLQLLENLGIVIQTSNNTFEEDREQPGVIYRRTSKRDVFSSVKRPWES